MIEQVVKLRVAREHQITLLLIIVIIVVGILTLTSILAPSVSNADSNNCTCQVFKEQNRILNKIERHMRDAQKH